MREVQEVWGGEPKRDHTNGNSSCGLSYSHDKSQLQISVFLVSD